MYRYRSTGDMRLISELVQRLGDDLYHFLLTQSDRQLAEDLSQSVWIRVIERPDAYESKNAQFKTWLFTLGRNQLIDELRRQHRWQMDELSDVVLEQWLCQSPDLQYEHGSFAQRFDHLLLELPFAQREAFVLQQEGFSLVDISTITGVCRETIKSRLRFARRYFQHHLEADSCV